MNSPVQGEVLNRPRRVIPLLGRLALIPLALIACLAGAFWVVKLNAAHKRAQWKNPALVRLATMTATNEIVRDELLQLKAGPKPGVDVGWTHDHVLLMTNGEYIVFEYLHGDDFRSVDHLFLGHGSDGKWLYSTFHFCNRMAM